MYIQCSKCQAHWCWQCGDWGGIKKRPPPHHVYDCNTPPTKSWVDAGGEIFADDGRFMFYFERSENHHAALKFAEENRGAAEDKCDQLMAGGAESSGGRGCLKLNATAPTLHPTPDPDPNSHTHPLLQADVIMAAAETLLQCRRVLRWSFVWAFFETEDGVRQLFEFSQKDLETMTEALSASTEQRSVEELTRELPNIVQQVSGYCGTD